MVEVWIRSTQEQLAKIQETGRLPEAGQQYEFDTTRPTDWLAVVRIRVPLWDLDPFVSDRLSSRLAVAEPLRKMGLIAAHALNELLDRGRLL